MIRLWAVSLTFDSGTKWAGTYRAQKALNAIRRAKREARRQYVKRSDKLAAADATLVRLDKPNG